MVCVVISGFLIAGIVCALRDLARTEQRFADTREETLLNMRRDHQDHAKPEEYAQAKQSKKDADTKVASLMQLVTGVVTE